MPGQQTFRRRVSELKLQQHRKGQCARESCQLQLLDIHTGLKLLTDVGVLATKLGHKSVASLSSSGKRGSRMHKLGMPGQGYNPSKIRPFPSSLLKRDRHSGEFDR
jgi:hypothetical protein